MEKENPTFKALDYNLELICSYLDCAQALASMQALQVGETEVMLNAAAVGHIGQTIERQISHARQSLAILKGEIELLECRYS